MERLKIGVIIVDEQTAFAQRNLAATIESLKAVGCSEKNILLRHAPRLFGVALTTQAFSSVYGGWVSILIAAALCCFAIATVLGWGLYGARCAQFLFGSGVWKRFVLLQAATVILSAMLKTGTVWLLSETVNGLMAIPNLIALAYLSPELRRLTIDYNKKLTRTGVNGGTYEDIYQCKPLRAFSHAQIPSFGGKGKGGRKEDLPSEHRPA